MITYEKMSLFDASVGSIIVHACNAQGVWGSGIAKEFKERYPKAYDTYRNFCDTKKVITGTSDYSSYLGENHFVAWMINSENYGAKVDNKTQVLTNTALSVKDLCEKVINYKRISSLDFKPDTKIKIYSNKFNSGLFKVPWEETEVVIKEVLKHYPQIQWIVCDPNLTQQE